MVSAADDIVEMITDRTSHTGGSLQLSESLDNLGLDSMEVVSLIRPLMDNRLQLSPLLS